MQKKFFLLIGMFSFFVTPINTFLPNDRHIAVCSSCGTILMNKQSLNAIQSSNGKKLLCHSCAKRMKEKKEEMTTLLQSTKKGSSPTIFTFSESVFPPVSPPSSSPISSPASSMHKKERSDKRSSSAPLKSESLSMQEAAQMGAFLAQIRKKKNPNAYSKRDVFISHPISSKDLNAIALFELLYAKRVSDDQLSKKEYTCAFHYGTRVVDVTAPDGKQSSFEMQKGEIPFLWKQGDVVLYTDGDGITVRDLEANYVHHFPLDFIPHSTLKTLSFDLGINRIEPISLYEEAERAHQEYLETLPSPSFK